MHRAHWQRLDIPGTDACRFTPTATGWTLTGAAVFDHSGASAVLAYRIDCDGRWLSERAEVTGWLGKQPYALRLERAGDSWLVNGVPDKNLTGLLDIDLGFTPASNTNALRRLALAEGAQAETTALWLDTGDWQMKPLPQGYHRLRSDAYAYTSPTHGYEAVLLVDDFSAITDYPGLWQAVPHEPPPSLDGFSPTPAW